MPYADNIRTVMAFLESHYKQRCELKLRGARVKRRSLLQRMKNPRTFECVFPGIEADGTDRRATVTVGTATHGSEKEGTGFFLYQQGRLAVGCVPIQVASAGQVSIGADKLKDEVDEDVYLGVVDMGAVELTVAATGRLEWTRELGKWRVVEDELTRVLGEYSGRSVVVMQTAAVVGTQTAAVGVFVGTNIVAAVTGNDTCAKVGVQGENTTDNGDSAGNRDIAALSAESGLVSQGTRGEGQHDHPVAGDDSERGREETRGDVEVGGIGETGAGGGDLIESGSPSESNWTHNGKGKIVDR